MITHINNTAETQHVKHIESRTQHDNLNYNSFSNQHSHAHNEDTQSKHTVRNTTHTYITYNTKLHTFIL